MQSKTAKTFIWSVIVLGAVICATAIYYLPIQQLDFQFILLAAFTILFGSRLSLQLPRSKVHFLMSDALIFISFLLYGGESAILL